MTASELLAFVGELRHGNKAYLSNAFFTLPQLEEMLSKPGVSLIACTDIALLLEDCPDMLRVYFYARDPEALKRIGKLLPRTGKPVIADVVGKEPAAGRTAEQLCSICFRPYSVFVRMVCSSPSELRSDGVENITLARPGEACEILPMLRDEFDPLFSHIPDVSELEDAIARGEITVYRIDGNIAGLAYFERVSGKYCVLRYFMVEKEYRGRNVGGALLHYTFSRGSADTVYMLWIGTYNKTRELYRRIGFTYDGLTDHILEFTEATDGKDL